MFKWGKYILLRRRDIEKSDVWFQKHGAVAIFFSRLLPVVRTFISLPAGIARMPFVPFLTLSFLGSVPWCYLLAYVGQKLGENWDSLKTYFHGADAVIGVILAGRLGVWLRHHLVRSRRDPGRLNPPLQEPHKATSRTLQQERRECCLCDMATV